MAERQKAQSGGFGEQEATFESALPPRGGILDYEDVLSEVGRAARLDRADKALDSLTSTPAILTAQNGPDVAAIVVATLATASQHPPRISVAVRKGSKVYGLIQASGFFAVNFVSDDQQAWIERYGVPHEGDPFAGVEYDRGVASGCPVLRGALAFIECKVAQSLDVGDHVLFVADLLDGGSLRDGNPLVRNGSYKPTIDTSENSSV